MENIPSRQYHSLMATKPYPSETQDRFIVRLPGGMRETIAVLAKKNNRSMNAEIVARLERTLSEDIVENVTSHPQFINKFMGIIERLIEEHGVEYVFPEENHEGKKRRIRPGPKKP
ncbi:MAG: Arc family DNA-binding protein [Telluria sp.]